MKTPYSKLNFIPLVGLFFLIFSCGKHHEPIPNNNINLKKGLLLYFPFSGDIADSSGNNNPAQTEATGYLTTDQHGSPNSAYDASLGRLLVTNNGSIQFDSAITVSFNFKLKSNGYQAYLSMVDNVTGLGPTFALGNIIQGNQNFSI